MNNNIDVSFIAKMPSTARLAFRRGIALKLEEYSFWLKELHRLDELEKGNITQLTSNSQISRPIKKEKDLVVLYQDKVTVIISYLTDIPMTSKQLADLLHMKKASDRKTNPGLMKLLYQMEDQNLITSIRMRDLNIEDQKRLVVSYNHNEYIYGMISQLEGGIFKQEYINKLQK